MVRRIGKDVQETVVAKLEVLYTKLPKGRPQKAWSDDIWEGIRTLYYPTASKRRSSLSQHILNVSQFHPAKQGFYLKFSHGFLFPYSSQLVTHCLFDRSM